MRFSDITTLYFLVIPVFAIGALIYGLISRKKILKRIGNIKTVEQQLDRPSPYLRAIKGIALVLGTTSLIIAAARPQYGGRIQMLKKRGIDVVVALDFSKSMLAQDVRPSRIERAKLELDEFMNLLTGDRIGLVAFAGDTMRFPLTTDYAAAKTFWKGLGPYDMPVGGTAIGRSLNAAIGMLNDNRADEEELPGMEGRSKVIILLTDGEDHVGTPLEVAQIAADSGIVVYVLGIGSDSPELIPRYLPDGTLVGYQKDEKGEYVTTSLSASSETILKDIATKTSGRYFRAGSDLSGMVSIVSEIRKMKQTEVHSRQITVYEEIYQWFLLPSFLLLILAFALPQKIERRRKKKSKQPIAKPADRRHI